jgi:outer membrane protein assembly factor BamE (lipoprotein component of BamABCDE complex)
MKAALRFIFSITAALVLTSCVSNVGKIDGSKLADLKIGMDKAEVTKILGKPQSASNDGRTETYHYWEDHGNWRHVYHVLIFQDEKLHSFQLGSSPR